MKLHRVERNGAPFGWAHWCPGCKGMHVYAVEQPNLSNGARWSFDGNLDAPTFSPSMLIFTTDGHYAKEPPHAWVPGPGRHTICHYFLAAGQIQFLNDSQHALAGQTVPLPDYPEHD